MSCRVGEGNVSEALLDSQDGAHVPLASLLALLWIVIHLEIDNSTNDEVILNFVGSQVIVAGPERTKDDLTTGLLLGKLSDVVAKLDVNSVLVSAEDVGPDTEKQVILRGHRFERLHTSLVTLGRTLVLVLVAGNLLWGQLGMNIQELKDLCADLVKLLKLDRAQHLNVLVAPLKLTVVVHRLCLAQFILHRSDHVLRDLALVYSTF